MKRSLIAGTFGAGLLLGLFCAVAIPAIAGSMPNFKPPEPKWIDEAPKAQPTPKYHLDIYMYGTQMNVELLCMPIYRNPKEDFRAY